MKRAIPPDVGPVVQQALLNMFLGCSTADIEAARSQALSIADKINKDFDKWLHDRRQSTATQHTDYNQERRRANGTKPQTPVRRQAAVSGVAKG